MERIGPEEFDRLVGEALDSIPEEFGPYLDNVAVTVEDEPARGELRSLRLSPGHTLFGIYRGTPLPDREAGYAGLPDTIVIFRLPILRAARSREEALEQIRDTVIHEIGHHFGFSDQDLP
jgi:predicted Zn-dependent protease with MMP-like domain